MARFLGSGKSPSSKPGHQTDPTRHARGLLIHCVWPDVKVSTVVFARIRREKPPPAILAPTGFYRCFGSGCAQPIANSTVVEPGGKTAVHTPQMSEIARRPEPADKLNILAAQANTHPVPCNQRFCSRQLRGPDRIHPRR